MLRAVGLKTTIGYLHLKGLSHQILWGFFGAGMERSDWEKEPLLFFFNFSVTPLIFGGHLKGQGHEI